MVKSRAIQTLLDKWPWPEDADIKGVEPFTWALDGGGRFLIQSVIDMRASGVLVEIGSFMGGAARTWLSANPGLTCVCVDPWADNLAAYTRRLLTNHVQWAIASYGEEVLDRYATLLETHGGIQVVRNNLVEFKDRCVMVRQGCPDVFDTLREVDLRPDIVFLDALKRREEFIGAHELFSDAIITGDDWSWRDEAGDFPVRSFAAEIAEARGAKIYAHRATFVICEPRHELKFDKQYLYLPPTS